VAVNEQSGALNGRWDWTALEAGAGVCLLLAIPLTLAAAFVDSDNSGTNALFFFGAMTGFVLGAGCAAWIQRVGTPISHGIVTAMGAYLAAQAVFITIRLIGDHSVNWFGVFFTLSLVMGAGLLGGLLGSLLQSRGFTPSVHRSSQ
jgi:hypothetical protein